MTHLVLSVTYLDNQRKRKTLVNIRQLKKLEYVEF